jgi:hypothetical protein
MQHTFFTETLRLEYVHVVLNTLGLICKLSCAALTDAAIKRNMYESALASSASVRVHCIYIYKVRCCTAI